jgi:hypothetical protein
MCGAAMTVQAGAPLVAEIAKTALMTDAVEKVKN